MVYGIQASQDVSSAGSPRARRADIVENWRTGPGCSGAGHRAGDFRRCRPSGLACVHQDTLIVIDPTDIRKLYAKRWNISPASGTRARGRSATGTAPAWRSPARRRPPDPPLHMRLWSSRRGGLHQPERRGARRHRPDRLPREEARHLRHRPRRRRTGCSTAWTGAKLDYIVRLVGNRNLLHGRRTALAEERRHPAP